MLRDLTVTHRELQQQVYLWYSLVKDYHEGAVTYKQYSDLAPSRIADCRNANDKDREASGPFARYVDDPEVGPLAKKVVAAVTLKQAQITSLEEMHRGILEEKAGKVEVGNSRFHTAAKNFTDLQKRYQAAAKEMLAAMSGSQ